MLQSLTIDNYALIDHTHIDFSAGFVVITGETGAGKSILLGALGLLLGQRADCQALHDKNKKCVVEANFDITSLELEEFFEANDLDYDETLIVRREILPSAKSRAFVNDSPVSLAVLSALGMRLVDIHAQHQTLRLADPTFQTSLLDALASDPSIYASYKAAYGRYSTLKHELERLTAEEQQNRKDLDYNQFLFDELNDARLMEGEQQELEEESNLLANAETIMGALHQVMALCEEDEESAIARLSTAKSQLEHTADCLPALRELQSRMDSTIIELRDILGEISALDDRIQYNPSRQQEVDERLDLLYRLERKHGVDNAEALIALRDELDGKLQSVSSMEQQIEETMEAVDKAFGEVQRLAEQITLQRKKAAQQFEEAIHPKLCDLGMKEARLKATVTPTEDFGPQGCDRVLFLFNANRGGEMREIAKVASGGELSRLMLGLKAIVASASLLPTIVFDEIDSGISGDISMRVSNILKQMSMTMQVVAITHLPQIAAAAKQHLKVAKAVEGEATVSRIRELGEEERVNEIAMMLSSDNPTASALQTARELMSTSKNSTQK